MVPDPSKQTTISVSFLLSEYVHRFMKPKILHLYYVLLQSLGKKINFFCNCPGKFRFVFSVADPFEQYTMSLVSGLLLDGEKAPFYRALLEPNIGSSYSPDLGYASCPLYSASW